MDGFLATLVFAAGIAAVIILTSKFKIQPFLVLFFVALAVGLASGLPAEGMGGIVVDGFSKVLGYTAVITVSALIIGVIMLQTGAVFVISKAILGLLGKERSHYAMGLIGYIVAYPVQCCDTSFIMLSPLLQSLTAGGGHDMMVYVLTLSAGAFVSYAMLFPAAPLLSVTLLGADIGSVLILGFTASLPALMVGLVVASYLGKRNKLNVDTKGAKTLEEIGAQYGKLPGMAAVFSVILVPTALIIGRSILTGVLDGDVLPLLDFIGNPVIALPFGVVLAILLLARNRGIEEINDMIAEGVNKSANVLMIVGSGSVLALVLQKTGVGVFLGNLAVGLNLPGLLVIFVIAALLKTAQGGTTVTMTTAAAIIGPLLPALGVSPVMAAMTICAGAMILMHVNDSFFWVVSGFTKMEVGTAYKTLTVIMAVMGLVAFACVAVLGPLLGFA
jgi:gluconate:H+ symporter, GntP family